jgi:hypothetical protein
MQWPHEAIEAHEFEGQHDYFDRTSHWVSERKYDRSCCFLIDLYFLNTLRHFVITFVSALSEFYSYADGLLYAAFLFLIIFKMSPSWFFSVIIWHHYYFLFLTYFSFCHSFFSYLTQFLSIASHMLLLSFHFSLSFFSLCFCYCSVFFFLCSLF